jgi:hypothetical protein
LLREEKEELMLSTETIKLLDTVALANDLPERKLKRGEVGTVVEILAPNVFEVEFSDDEGQTYAELALRGDQLIPIHSQGETPMPDCFISYSSQDQNLANFVNSELRRLGVSSFMASASLQPGQHWSPEIMNNLKSSKWVILLASRAAVGSAFVNQEIGGALINSKVLIPIVWDINPSELPGWARSVQAIDLRGSTMLGLQNQVGAIAGRIHQEKTKSLLIAVGAVLLGIFVFSDRD